MFCTNCGAQISKDQSFCDKCGQKVQIEEPAVAEAVEVVEEAAEVIVDSADIEEKE